MSLVAQYFTSVILGLLTSLSLLVISLAPGQIWPAMALGVWFLFILFLWWRLVRRNLLSVPLFSLLIFTWLGFACMIGITEILILRLPLAIVSGVILGLCLWWSFFHDAFEPFVQKRLRRMLSMLLVFDTYSVLTMIFALHLFFPDWSFWALSTLGAGLSAGISITLWRLYYSEPLTQFLFWALIVALMMVEIFWTMQFLPFGYFILGLFTAWVWYLTTLLLRFHISKQGIVWKEQWYFLAGNAILFVVVLYFTKWI